MSKGAHPEDAGTEAQRKANEVIDAQVARMSDANQTQIKECIAKLREVMNAYGWLGYIALAKLSVWRHEDTENDR